MGAERITDYPFDILWVAEQCGLLDGKINTSGEEWNVRCPLDGCNDKKTHLGLNLSINTWKCPHCGSGGGMVDLYARIFDLSRKEATRQLYKLWRGSDAPRPHAHKKRIQQAISEAPKSVEAPIERRDAAYRALLGHLKGLTDEHLLNLRSRGLTMEDILRLGFKSLVYRKRHLAVTGQIDTTDVSGFYTYKGRRMVNTDLEGILIPYQDLYGRIGMLELRMFGEKKRYMRFSSGKQKDGRTECCKSVSTVHHVGIDPHNPPKKVYMTEGALKADVANALSSLPFIAISGVTNQAGLENALRLLKEIGVETIVLAFDMDLYSNQNVRKGIKSSVKLIKKVGLKVHFATWDQTLKGIDDFYWAKVKHLAGIS